MYEIHPSPWHVSPLPHTLMASALGLLLVFRTNAVRSGLPTLPPPQPQPQDLRSKPHSYLSLAPVPSGVTHCVVQSLAAQAYDRFWEARKIWGNVVNICRNLARTGSVALHRRFHLR